jgi:NIPSNAP
MKIVELRQYTLRPGQRDVLVELFDRELVETQEATGMAILGQFRDLDRPDRFVWLRGFPDLTSRVRSLTEFYGGPSWKAHAAAANATMLDVDDVLLLRPVGRWSITGTRPARGAMALPPSRVLVTVHFRDEPFDDGYAGTIPDHALACLRTEYAVNDFPGLPVREGVHAFVWIARFPTEAALDAYLCEAGPVEGVRTTERLRLAPTARSLLR